MKILFFAISGRNGASSRYRVYQYLPILEAAGFQAKVMPPLFPGKRGLSRAIHGILEKAVYIRAARKTDIVFIQKRLFAQGFVRKLTRLCGKTVFDFDDSLFTSPRGDWSALTKSRTLERVKAVLGGVQVVIAGNAFLKAFAESSRARRVGILPTPIDTSKVPVKTRHTQGRPVVGWIGSAVNHPYLDLLSHVLPPLSAEFPALKLLMVSNESYAMPGVVVENRAWSEETEARDIQDMDVGLMPLPDNEWTRGKCALKALQYMACGIPAVCSPVGANLEVVEEGKQGFLPLTDGEWIECLGRLLMSSGLRENLGRQARRKVEADYSLATMGPKMIELLRSL